MLNPAHARMIFLIVIIIGIRLFDLQVIECQAASLFAQGCERVGKSG
jgi:hypothetical protein